MIQLIFFWAIGLALFVAVYSLGIPTSSAEGSAKELLLAREALSTLQTGLLPPEMVERIFAKEDFDFISQNAIPVKKLFLAERRRIAISWVTHMRARIVSLKRFHLGSARLHAGLKLRTEIQLAAEFTALLCMCRGLQLILYLRGPYGAPAMVGRATAAAYRVCQISEKSLGFLNPTLLDSLRNDSARNPTAL